MRLLRGASFRSRRSRIEMLDRAWPEQDRVDARAVGKERVRELDEREAVFLRDRFVGVGELEEAVCPVPTLVERVLVEPRPFGRLSCMRVFAREQAACERVVDGRMNFVFFCEAEVFDIELSDEHVVEDLRHDRARQASFFCDLDHFEDLPGGVVRDGPALRFAGSEHGFDAFEGFFERRVVVGYVQVKHVDAVHPEALEAFVEGGLDALFFEAFGFAVDSHKADFGRDESLVATVGEGFAEHFFCEAVDVGIGGVEERDAPVYCVVDEANAFGFAHSLAEVHRANGEGWTALGGFGMGKGSEEVGHGRGISQSLLVCQSSPCRTRWNALTLRAVNELVRFALTSFFPRVDDLPGLAELGVEQKIADLRRDSTWLFWLGIAASSVFFQISPILTVRSLSLASWLSPEDLDRHANGLATSRLYLVRQLTMILKLVGGMFWGQSPEIRAFLQLPPYPPDPGTRRTEAFLPRVLPGPREPLPELVELGKKEQSKGRDKDRGKGLRV